jgi:hypothetical protein
MMIQFDIRNNAKGLCIVSVDNSLTMQECNANNAIALLDSFGGTFHITHKNMSNKECKGEIRMQSIAISLCIALLHYCIVLHC